eukprot:7112057-Pyramimonas_sp.AAC.1
MTGNSPCLLSAAARAERAYARGVRHGACAESAVAAVAQSNTAFAYAPTTLHFHHAYIADLHPGRIEPHRHLARHPAPVFSTADSAAPLPPP